MNKSAFYIKLQGRGLIHLEGEDRHTFLQGLVSNDIDLLQTQPCIYACLLTPQGKFLHDFFVIEGNDFTLLECEGGARTQDLYKRLNMYRLRAKVKISVEENVPVYAAFDAAHGVQDPRHPDMGYRAFEQPQDGEEKPFAVWDEQRIRLGIPDGSRDMVPESSTLAECNIERFHGVSYEKGCYVGQELTARMHHRGLAKKHLYAVEPNLSFLRKQESAAHNQPDPGFRRDDGLTLPTPGTDITAGERLVGEMRSSCGTVGLALLKDEMLESMPETPLRLLK